jgi:hypothetical protein
MRKACFGLGCGLVLTVGWALGQQTPALVGTWVGKVEGYGIEMELVLNADGSADFEGEAGRWRVQSSKLLLTQEGETTAYEFKLQGSQLTLTGGDLMAPLTLSRAGGAGAPGAGRARAPAVQEPEEDYENVAPAAPGVPRATEEVTPGRAPRPAAPSAQRPTGAKSPAPTPSVATRGSRYSHEKWGLSFATPPGWKVGERQGVLLLGCDTEAGLIIIRLARRTSLEQLVQDYGEGMQEEGLQLMPATEAQEFPAGQNRAMAGELAGMAQDGARIRARAVAVASPFGDAAVVLGMTTEEKYAGLKPRVESIAASFRFTQPQAAPVPEFLAGQYYYISTSSYGSTERYIDMCSDGRFSSRTGTYSTGDAGTSYGEGGQSAQWTAEGDESQGVIIVTNPNGETERYEYRRSGSDLFVNNRTFARYGDGSCSKTSVY